MTEEPMIESESGMGDAAGEPEPTPEIAPAKPGEPGIARIGDPEADAEALAAYPYAELREYALAVGIEPAKSKAETITRILSWMYPPGRGHVEGAVIPQAEAQGMSARIARIRNASQG